MVLHEITFSIDKEAKDFAQAFAKSINDIQRSISEEVTLLVGDDKAKVESLKDIFVDLIRKAVAKHHNSKHIPFSECFRKEQNKILAKGITLKEIHLSRLIYTSEIAAGSLSSGELDEAFSFLSMTNRYFGEYKNSEGWDEYFHLSLKKDKQEQFKRDTLLKLIFGMANNGYDCNRDKVEFCSSKIGNSIKSHNISVKEEFINQCLYEAYQCETDWIDGHANSGTVTEEEKANMLQLILGMAIDKYGYNPNDKHNAATGNNKYSISAKISPHIFVNYNTIKSCLDTAKQMIYST